MKRNDCCRRINLLTKPLFWGIFRDYTEGKNMSLLKRIYRIARAGAGSILKKDDPFGKDAGWQEDFQEKAGRYSKSSDYQKWNNEQNQYDDSGYTEKEKKPFSDYPTRVVEDLAVFGLTPPSSLEEVRKARNREIRKYHSDRFMNDPEKLATSKEIMQIFNAAYDRLKKYYGIK